jgi:hypothetical protein
VKKENNSILAKQRKVKLRHQELQGCEREVRTACIEFLKPHTKVDKIIKHSDCLEGSLVEMCNKSAGIKFSFVYLSNLMSQLIMSRS